MISFWDGPANDLLWDTLILGGVVWPGIASVEIDKSREIDKAKQKGKDGITLTDNGFNASAIKITLRLHLADQWADLQNILPNFDPKVTGSPKTPCDIIHPTTQLSGIKYVYIEKVHLENPSNGVLTLTMEACEWFPETKATKSTKKPKGLDGTDSDGGDLVGFDVSPNPPSQNGQEDNF